MIESELLNHISWAFGGVRRPSKFTCCDRRVCNECRDLTTVLEERTPETLTDQDLRHSNCLLSPEAFHYFLPGLIRISLPSGDPDSDLADGFITDLCTPISKASPPRCHRKATAFTRQQTAATLAFLIYIRDNSDWKFRQLSREITRGIKNWQWFVQSHDESL